MFVFACAQPNDYQQNHKTARGSDKYFNGYPFHSRASFIYKVLDTTFTVVEMQSAIKDLGKGKAPGMDDMINEYFTEFNDVLVPYLCKLFNAIPGTDYVNNYCGITLHRHVSKLFATVLNRRLIDVTMKMMLSQTHNLALSLVLEQPMRYSL